MTNHLKKEKKDHVVTIRISTKLNEFLKKHSKNEDLPVSLYIERILTEQLKWKKYSHQIHLLEIFSELFIEMLELLPEDKVKTLGSGLVAKLTKDAIIFEHGELTLLHIFSIIERWATHNSMTVKVMDFGKNKYRFILRHRLGKSFSILQTEVLIELSKKSNYSVNVIDLNDSMLVLEMTSEENIPI